MHTLREALPTFNANPDGGAFIITASIAVGQDLIIMAQPRTDMSTIGNDAWWKQHAILSHKGSM
jgi:hypothetical protein